MRGLVKRLSGPGGIAGGRSGRRASARSEVAGPKKKADQLQTLPPEEAEEFGSIDRFRWTAGVGFDAQLQIFAAPRREAMTAGCIPQEAQRSQHFLMVEHFAESWVGGSSGNGR